ncbi:hypothetical protein [Naasia aerilata]|uniref:Uncharacterized protein n=1 Tax=Naasia aerilata TaxID=1162966 RepID=A0ABM8GAZ1_9MICO|nr:hypothetical protein [Naasia aerilata]BDZ45390.1 hypothetical protein GCM10025866_12990 [Naasia aerilata]
MPNLGLLFDVDGPLASPLTRTVAIPGILDDLVTLAAAGVPIAFITGRSDAFVEEQLLAPLLDAGLPAALESGHGRMFGVFEKGAVWAPITATGMGAITVDESVRLPESVVHGLRTLTEREFADTMFFDDTKRAMVSVEQRTDVDADRYKAAQAAFNDAAFALLVRAGVGIGYGSRFRADEQGELPFRIDPTIISTDIESVLLDKDRGAERAVRYFSELGELPRRWRTVGDSRSDYKMADYLHAAGFEVAHVDVRPSDGIPEKPYPVVTLGDSIHDEAGALFLDHWVEELTG